jgi:hypothetical protein
MEQLTLTMAGLQASAGGARLRGGSGVHQVGTSACAPAAPAASYGHLHAASWSVEGIAEPTTATFMVFDGKNRRTRQPSELSP